MNELNFKTKLGKCLDECRAIGANISSEQLAEIAKKYDIEINKLKQFLHNQ